MRRSVVIGALALPLLLASIPDAHALYTLRPTALRKTAAPRAKVLRKLDANATLVAVAEHGALLEVKTLAGARGFLPKAHTSTTRVEIFKKEGQLVLLRAGREVARYRAAFAPGRRNADKVQIGDLATPEGRFYLAELDAAPKASRYGARSMRLSYPNIEDARRGLKSKLITRRAYASIVRAIRAGRVPNQRTKLGSSIRIHGGGSSADWTAGCIGLDDKDVVALFAQIARGTRVDLYRSRAQKKKLASPTYLAQRVLAGAKAQLKKPALYTGKALGLIAMNYPGGDIRPDWAVCTDVIVRALRPAGLDLQALIHEDALVHPRRYRPVIRRPNTHIDHRRARNHHRFFSHHAKVLPDTKDYRPGDIVVMETIAGNGTNYDHIGIVDDRKTKAGHYAVINIWTVGYRTASMALLAKDYPTITGHFRLLHPFETP